MPPLVAAGWRRGPHNRVSAPTARSAGSALKITFLVLTHSQAPLLEAAARVLDRPGFEFGIFVDGKVDIGPFRRQLVDVGHVSFVEERHPVYWCGHSTLRAIQKLLHWYVSSGRQADYVFFLSGTCFPVVNSEAMVQALQLSAGRQLISVDGNVCEAAQKDEFVRCWHFHDSALTGRGTGRVGLAPKALHRAARTLARLGRFHLPARALPKGVKLPSPLVYGSSWWGLTHNAAAFAERYTREKSDFFNYLRFSNVPEEFYFQNILMASGYIADAPSEALGGLARRGVYGGHFIDWGGGGRDSPLVMKDADVDEACASGALFARKVDLSASKGFVEGVLRRIEPLRATKLLEGIYSQRPDAMATAAMVSSR